MKTINSLKSLKKKLKIDKNGPAQKEFIATCYRYMYKYIPKDTGMLRRVVYLDKDGITFMSPYAEYQYYGHRSDGSHQVKKYTTKGTGPKWDRVMMKLDGEKVIKEVKKYIRTKNR